TWILREPGIGRVTDSDSSAVWRSRSDGTAFIASSSISIRRRELFVKSPRGEARPSPFTCRDARECTIKLPTPVLTGSGSKGLSQPAVPPAPPLQDAIQPCSARGGQPPQAATPLHSATSSDNEANPPGVPDHEARARSTMHAGDLAVPGAAGTACG